MLFSLRDIEGFKLGTQDGDFGKIKAFLIDDFDWVVRYLHVEIEDRQVILSPRAVSNIMMKEGVVTLDLDLDTIMNSPHVDLDKDLSRELERQLSDYYHWPYYWEPTEYPNTMPGDLTVVPLVDMELERQNQEEEELIPETGVYGDSAADHGEGHFHLRSTHEIFGYTLHTTNDRQNAGKLEDMVVQGEDWNIMYLIADTSSVLSDRKVLVSPNWVQEIDEDNRRILINLTEETILKSPEFHSVEDLTPDFQTRHRKHFGE